MKQKESMEVNGRRGRDLPFQSIRKEEEKKK
jgi:hypothetical protein